MDVELLVVPECPHEESAYDLALAALAGLDVSASVVVTVIDSGEEAQARGFTGSPTFLINGLDPLAHRDAAVGLACGCTGRPPGWRVCPG